MFDRLLHAVNSHDPDAVAGCFTEDYVNETPLHPARGFRGRDQVQRNWRRIFAAVPDVTARVLRRSGDDRVVWSEWEMSGTRRDGSPHLMRGVVVFGIEDAHAAWARFYLEPVDASDAGVDAAVRAQVVR